ncbi:transcriptional regulator [Pedobacter sp. Du54]|uniref:transcriptional regulator n=1 Tax=Pedobacter anseongensis TaxID=3133439 RepID=UPI003099E064
MELVLMQKDVAKLIKVTVNCITFWETNRSKPQMQHYPLIISFLGYNPFVKKDNYIEQQIFAFRCEHGLSYKRLGKLLNVDASTVRA